VIQIKIATISMAARKLRGFFVTGCDSSETLYLIEEAFDRVSLYINPRTEGKTFCAVSSFGRDIDPGFLFFSQGLQSVCVI
jgi:hypothetical protein